MNNASQYMNDLRGFDDDFKQRQEYRQQLMGEAQNVARQKISQYAQQAGVDKNLAATLRLTAGEEGEAALAIPAAVEGIRQGVGYASKAISSMAEEPEFGTTEGTLAEVGAGGEAAEAATAATGAAAIAEGAGEIAATNWWNVLGWGAAAVAVGSAVVSGVEAAEADSQAKTQQNLASSTQAQTQNMPSFAGRYVVPVQNALQNE
jgi:hypothetical protein